MVAFIIAFKRTVNDTVFIKTEFIFINSSSQNLFQISSIQRKKKRIHEEKKKKDRGRTRVRRARVVALLLTPDLWD
jgi:hypothetical protein